MNDQEARDVIAAFDGRFRTRNVAFFVTGLRTGFRLSELLALRRADALRGDDAVDAITVRRRSMKGRRSGRTVRLHWEARQALAVWGAEMPDKNPKALLFGFSSVAAWKILRRAFERAAVHGNVSSHSMRKTFAQHMYKRLERNLYDTAEALGHKSITSTVSYLSFDQKRIDAAILADEELDETKHAD